jgi:hypothetical protein
MLLECGAEEIHELRHETPENALKTLPQARTAAADGLGRWQHRDGGLLRGVFGTEPLRAWQTLLVNYLFWSGMAFGCILFVAI